MPKWGAQVTVSKGFMGYEGDTGYLLHYSAHQVRDLIIERTAKGKAVSGAQFAPYKERAALERDDNGKIKRDANGKWSERSVRRPGDAVRLRSPYTVARGKRLMENLIISPKMLEGKTSTMRRINAAFVRPSGSRGVSRITGEATADARLWRDHITAAGGLSPAAKAAGVKRRDYKALSEAAGVTTEMVRHTARAATCQAGAHSKGNPRRPFVGVSSREWSAILAGIRRDHILAFVKETKRSVRRQIGKKARAAALRAQRARKRGADAKAQAAESQHRQTVERYRALFGDVAV